MIDSFNSRTIGLLKEDSFKRIQQITVMIVGLGGVGGTALEALVRTGVTNVILVDFDVVNLSNLNRQILYTNNDVGLQKVEVAKQRVLSINPSCKVISLSLKIVQENITAFNSYKIDFIIDAIDDVNGKIALFRYAIGNNIKIISSLGMANRFNPQQVMITTLNKTTTDPLARKLRYEIKKAGLDANKIPVAVSLETPLKDGPNLNSIMTVPSSSGLNIAYYIIMNIIGGQR